MGHSKIYSAVYKVMYRAKIIPAIKKGLKWWMMTRLLPETYNKAAKKPVNSKKVVFIEVRYDNLTDNFKLLYRAFKKRGFEISVFFLKNISPNQLIYIRRCVRLMKLIGDAKYVFLNDACEPFSSIQIREETKVIQVWHACAAFKKWGMSTADKLFGASAKEQLKYSGYKNLDLVTVSSPEVVWAYEEAMNLNPEAHIVQPLGTSRTDIFFSKAFRKKAADKVKEVFPLCKEKKIILYAPTFRGHVRTAKAPDRLDIPMMKAHFGENYVLLVKQHPFVKNRPEVPEDCADFAKDVTDEMQIEELLCVSDICISDYSSLVFEYSLFEKPMIFFAYDYEDYCDWRGFYYDYDELTPGPVVQTNEEIMDYIHQWEHGFDASEVRAFRDKFMSACDGHATKRLMSYILEETESGGKS